MCKDSKEIIVSARIAGETDPAVFPFYTTPPAAQRSWVGLMQGVRVEREYVVVSVHGGNGVARKLCEALIQEMNK
jgi:hypothetical protein